MQKSMEERILDYMRGVKYSSYQELGDALALPDNDLSEALKSLMEGDSPQIVTDNGHLFLSREARSVPKKTVTKVFADDWCALYLDGTMVWEGHSLSDTYVLEMLCIALGVKFQSFLLESDEFGNRFPTDMEKLRPYLRCWAGCYAFGRDSFREE